MEIFPRGNLKSEALDALTGKLYKLNVSKFVTIHPHIFVCFCELETKSTSRGGKKLKNAYSLEKVITNLDNIFKNRDGKTQQVRSQAKWFQWSCMCECWTLRR